MNTPSQTIKPIRGALCRSCTHSSVKVVAEVLLKTITAKYIIKIDKITTKAIHQLLPLF